MQRFERAADTAAHAAKYGSFGDKPASGPSRKRKAASETQKSSGSTLRDELHAEAVRKMQEFGIERHQAEKLGLFGTATSKPG